jgi:hypothetical protein
MKYSLPGETATEDTLKAYKNSASSRSFFNTLRDREFLELIKEQEKYPLNKSQYLQMGTFIEAFSSLRCKQNFILTIYGHRHNCVGI